MTSSAALLGEAPGLADRSELVIAGLELSDGFPSLRDPDLQARLFDRELRRRRGEGRPTVALDTRYLAALGEGIPPGPARHGPRRRPPGDDPDRPREHPRRPGLRLGRALTAKSGATTRSGRARARREAFAPQSLLRSNDCTRPAPALVIHNVSSKRPPV